MVANTALRAGLMWLRLEMVGRVARWRASCAVECAIDGAGWRRNAAASIDLALSDGLAGMQQRDDRELREKLVNLRDQHRALDLEIVSLERNPDADQLTIKRLKKKKLQVKDQITDVEDQLTPDIIA